MKCEAKDAQLGQRGWIKALADSIVELAERVEDKPQFLKQHRAPKVITFNYDRTFEFHFFGDLERRLEEAVGVSNWERYGPQFLLKSVLHPHGAIGSAPISQSAVQVSANGYANLSSNRAVAYGALDGVAQSWTDKPTSPFLYTVDAFKDSGLSKPTYDGAQQLLNNADALLIGLSPTGQRNQKLDFSIAKSVRVNNHASEYEKSELLAGGRMGADVVCLGMKAEPLITSMINLNS